MKTVKRTQKYNHQRKQRLNKKKRSKMKRRTKSNNIDKKGPRLSKLRKIFLNHNYHRLRQRSRAEYRSGSAS